MAAKMSKLLGTKPRFGIGKPALSAKPTHGVGGGVTSRARGGEAQPGRVVHYEDGSSGFRTNRESKVAAAIEKKLNTVGRRQ